MRMFLLVAVVRACVAPEEADTELTPVERFNARWVRRTEQDVLLWYGRPSDVIELEDGNHINSYHREFQTSEAGVAVYQGSGGGHSVSLTVYCDRRFVIDKATHLVVIAIITGNRCDYDR